METATKLEGRHTYICWLLYRHYTLTLDDLCLFFWQRLFYQYDVDGSGMLNSFELRRVLGAAGFKVDNSTMKSLVWRFADEKFCISLDSYFLCLGRIMKLFSKS